MPFDDVLASMKEAKEFFATYFKRRVLLFVCCLWILNPAWEDLLPYSNMVRFRKEGYAFPGVDWGKRAGMEFLFGRADVPPEELPAHNNAQRAMQEASQKGQIGTGGVFFLTDDLDKLGDEYYRKHSQWIGKTAK